MTHQATEWLKAVDLSSGYGAEKLVIADLSLSIARGEIVAILGASGVGKSTLIRTIAGHMPYAGILEFEGATIKKPSIKRGLVFQKANLYPWLTVFENLKVAAPSASNESITKMLNEVGLNDSRRLYPKSLSGGMKKRAALARVLVSNPTLLLLDEPFSSLDVSIRNTILKLLSKTFEQYVKSMVIVTHDINDALVLADRVLLMGGAPSKIVAEWPNPQARQHETLYDSLQENRELYRDIYAKLVGEASNGR